MGILDESKQIQQLNVIAIRAVVTYKNARVRRKEGASFWTGSGLRLAIGAQQILTAQACAYCIR